MGGKLKSSNLLCNECNSKIGHEADGELAQQFQFMSGYLQVKRDNGKIPTTKGGKLADGTRIDLIDGIRPRFASPKYEATPIADGFCYNVVARDEVEMRSILTGLKRKHPNLDIEDAMKAVNHKKERLNEHISFSQTFGGELAFRSIAKSALNFYMLNKGSREQVLDLISYVSGQIKLDVVKHFHSKKNSYRKDANEIIHLLHVVAKRREKLLYCYVEFFSTHSYLVLLSSDYCGPNRSHTYAYNLLTGKEVNKVVDLNLTASEIVNMDTHFKDFPQVKDRSDRFMKIATKLQTDNIIDNIISTAVNDIFAVKYGHEKIITHQMSEELSGRIAHDMVAFYTGNYKW
ncbi:HNH endonuclease [Rurimicrobium arvi]|uniref:HNH endonuclease n=2 Tax=Rurimicrobium arvi TaxID=2049916 RepID=A0ABP8MEQ2_9BACT